MCSAGISKKVEEWLQYRQAVSTEYERRELAEQQFQILKRYGTPQEQNDFINRHLSNPEYRRMAIQNAIDAGDESTVERLALDGEYENQALPGLLQEWQNVAITAITEQENGKSWRMFAKRC